MKSVEYVARRKGNILANYEFFCTDSTENNMHKRVIIPCYWKGQLIGSTSRTVEDGIKPKYHADYEPNFVFNTDRQVPGSKFVIVSEGPFDAMAVDGVAVLSNECSEVQADIIDSMGREVIVVPDFDFKSVKGRDVWAGSRLVEQAIEYGWSVSFPVWRDDVKDVSAAVEKYGKLFVLKAILQGKQSSRLKIELMKKRIHN
jgi:DNA primase